jgi:dolichol kinase
LGIFAYLFSFNLVLFNWFYLRPKQIKKQQSKVDEIISKLEMLIEQLDEKNKASANSYFMLVEI